MLYVVGHVIIELFEINTSVLFTFNMYEVFGS
jgi:hypothetical protein